ncbi:MAG: cysteine desulfurase [Legionellales bacterium]|nr:cysteine desulfurase [Legionellales bacterium]
MQNKLIPFLDSMATTPVDPDVVTAMLPFLSNNYGNPSSNNYYGNQARAAIEKARQQVATAIGTQAEQIIFTSGATESINLAIKGAANFYRKSGNHIITLTTEHAATLASCQHLESKGFDVTYINPETNGILDLNKLKQALRTNTILVSICHVNNEIGVIQDIEAIAEIVAASGALLHVDGAQTIGKAPLNLHNSKIAMMSFSAHKSYGPKGVGALYLRSDPKLHLSPLNHGGGQEKKIRAGTLATHQIVGMGKAFEIAALNHTENLKHVISLAKQLKTGLESIPNTSINGDIDQRVPHNLNITFHKLPGDILFNCIQSEIAVASGSACNTHEITVSHVLTAIGISRDDANATIRYSIGKHTTTADIKAAIDITKTTANKLTKSI